MRLFSSIKLAPGVRLSTTSRGLRAHVGPRGARVHVGGGRTGISTGAGPFTLYQGAGGAPRSRRTTAGSSVAAQKAQLNRDAAAHLSALEGMHRVAVAGPAREVAPPVKLRPFSLLVATAERQELKEVGRFDRSARREARARARTIAEGWAHDLLVLAEQDRAGRQAVIDEAWSLLVGNDPATVRSALADAFRAAGAPVSTFDVVGDIVTLRMVGPAEQDLPTVKPKVTQAGNATVGQITKGERASWLAAMTAARVLIATKQVFAWAPGIQVVRVLVTSPIEGNQPVLAARMRRSRFAGTSFSSDALSVLQAAADDVVIEPRGRSRELGRISVPGEYAVGSRG